MLKKIALVLLVITPLCISGCIFLAVGAGAAGGYLISQDTVQADMDTSFGAAWKAAVKAANSLGETTLQDEKVGTLEIKVKDADVKILLDQLTPKTVRIKVTARKFMLPEIKTAHKVYARIMQYLK